MYALFSRFAFMQMCAAYVMRPHPFDQLLLAHGVLPVIHAWWCSVMQLVVRASSRRTWRSCAQSTTATWRCTAGENRNDVIWANSVSD